ncbi:unnamed protein product [Mesocestoides corti]|uniref:Methyltransferase domain-containing protein n=2 Tax=Mesocestoides corti TaxID=53468 RepID=A0A0R3U756_MESCO|nr:unnamed protein product [Mesocestoides corti]
MPLYSFLSTPHEYFACCSFWGTLVGTWSSAFVLVLDWDRPWQAWPIPCVMGAVIGFSLGFFAFLLRRYLTHPFVDRSRCYVNTGDSVKSREELLDHVLVFLSTYSWVYSFKWTELLTCHGKSSDPVVSCPPDWIAALTNGKISHFQNVVVGGDAPDDWPDSLRRFANQCATFTRELMRLATAHPPTALRHDSKSRGFLCSNHPADCLHYHCKPQGGTGQAQRKVKWKKKHEIGIMSAFLCDLLDDSVGFSPAPTTQCRDRTRVTFQTAEFEEACSCESQGTVSTGIEFNALVDVGSGLGHLPRLVMQRLRAGDATPRRRVVAVEADAKLHNSAVDMEEREPNCHSRLIRVHARVTTSEVHDLRERLSMALSALETPRYLLCGLHCCGDLSEAVIEAFLTDPNARGIALVGCCYHKMEDNTFPLSSSLQEAFTRNPEAVDPLQAKVTLRLACQWSPQQWARWTPEEVYEHRVRVFVRSILEVYLNPDGHSPLPPPLKRVARLPPVVTKPPSSSQAECVVQPLPSLDDHWRALHSLEPALEVTALANLVTTAQNTWHLLPGIIMLQQLVQPLLEALILADRVWKVEEADDVAFATLVRLFDPSTSPRCVALVAYKNHSK